ncbi:YceD family protein [Virgibacillus natechei]|uniref:YceD family protein n=1 Tax=Virgibacillus sp. CBA3643 TaxID=2942278 RepID=UPI0035A27AC8
MKFILGQIRKDANHEPYPFDDEVDVSELETMKNDIREMKPVRVHGNYIYQDEQIIFSFIIEGEMILPCARTLVDVPYPFEIKADEVFTTSRYYGEKEAENEIHPVDGEILDLTPYIKENILLEVPFRVFSKEAIDEEKAPVKGEGWEFVSQKSDEKKIDPRLKKLESLFKDDDEKQE